MDIRLQIYCVSCGSPSQKIRKSGSRLACHKCSCVFTIDSRLDSDEMTLKMTRYSGKTIVDNSLEDGSYPAIFCVFCGKGGRTKLLEPKSEYRFQCQNRKCSKIFHPVSGDALDEQPNEETDNADEAIDNKYDITHGK